MLPAGPTEHTASALLQARRVPRAAVLPAVQRFAEMLPGRVLATNDFKSGAWAMRRAEALLLREVAPDPEGSMPALRFDVDAADGATRWLDAELPPPNIIVTNPRNGHAHYTYFLARWVRLDNARAVAYAGAVCRAITAALRADPAYSGKFTHNPLHDAFAVTSPRSEPYTLDELATYLDLEALPQRAAEISTLGRNCETFDRVRQWSYNVVGGFKREGSEAEFAEVVRRRVEAVNNAFAVPLPACEVRSISKSIAGWCWHVYRSRDPKARERRLAAWRAREEARREARAVAGRSKAALLNRMLERNRRIAELAKAGRSASDIAQAVHVSRRQVYRVLASSVVASDLVTRVPTPSELAREAQPPAREEQPARSQAQRRFVSLRGSFVSPTAWRERLQSRPLSQRRGPFSSSHPP